MTVKRVQWGVECWQYGDNFFYLRLGSGAHASRILRMRGSITASALPGAAASGYSRQTLVSITKNGATLVPDAEIVSGPGGSSFSQGISANYLQRNLKQSGSEVQVIEFDCEYGDESEIFTDSGGFIRMDVNNLSSNGSTTTGLPAVECVDAEIQVEIEFEELAG